MKNTNDPKITTARPSGSPEQVLTKETDAPTLSAKDLRRLIRERKKNPPEIDDHRPTSELNFLGLTEWDKLLVEHRPGCRCAMRDDGMPAYMCDERNVTHRYEVLSALAVGGIFDAFAEALAQRGCPLGRISETRRNDRGEGIGPRLEVRSCEASAFWDLEDQVVALIEQAADALAGNGLPQQAA